MIGAMVNDSRWNRLRWWEWIGLASSAGLVVIYSPPVAGAVPLYIRALAWLMAIVPLYVRHLANPGVEVTIPRLRIVGRAQFGVGAFYVLGDAFRPGWEGYFTLLICAWAAAVILESLDGLRIENREKQRLLRESRDEALRLKLAPHFFFNALNTMKAQIASDPQGAASTADRLAALLRQVLDGSGRLTVPLREELAFVESYLGIERIRLGDRLRVKLEIPEAAEAMGIPPLSLQVLVENAVKHGIAPREEGGEIRIWARSEPWGTREKVWVGVDSPLSEGAQAGPGVGLETLRDRLRDPADLVLRRDDGLFRAKFGWIDDREPAPG